MIALEGIAARADLGTGGWVLHADDGETWQLEGTIPNDLDGSRVRVEGRRSDRSGFLMTGPILTVSHIRPIPSEPR